MDPKFLLAIALTLPLCAQVKITQQGKEKISVEIDGKPFTDFYIGPETAKPYLHPLRTADGKVVTRGFPMVTDIPGEAHDHPHHRGLWFTHGDVNGYDFWANEESQPGAGKGKGKVVLERLDKPASGRKSGTISGSFAWQISRGETLLLESRKMTFYADPQVRIIDFDITLSPQVEVKFGDTKEGMFAMRLASPLALTSARGIYLMTDECYCKFLYDSEPFSIASLPGAKETVLVAGSLSKTYAMTGWRIGFGLVPPAIVQAMTKLQSHSTSNPCSISQKAAVEALRGPQESVGIMLAEYRKRRDFVVARLRAIPGVRCNEPRGAFYVYPNVSVAIGKKGIANTLEFSERLLAESHVAVVPGEAFGTNHHIRISYATSLKELDRGLERIHQFIVKNS